MKALAKRIDNWCFGASDRYQLGIFRVLLLAWFAWFYSERLFARLHGAADRPVQFFTPPSLARWFSLPLPVSEAELSALQPVVYLLLVGALLGLFTRPCLVLLAGLNLLLGLSANAWGYSMHASALPSVVLVLIAFAPGATSFSVDAVIWRRRTRAQEPSAASGPEVLPRRPASVWPVRAVLLFLCLLYFSAGYSKLRYSGLAWVDGKTLSFYLGGGSVRRSGNAQRFFQDPNAQEKLRFRDGVGLVDYAYVGRPSELGLWVSRQPTLLKALSITSLLWELLFPLSLLGRRPRGILLLAGGLFHVGIAMMLRINFASYLVCYAIFVDWIGLGRTAQRVWQAWVKR